MANCEPRHIDWRRQFEQLDRYLDGAGGVVTVRYNGERCGHTAFLGTLKAAFEARSNGRTLAKPEGISVILNAEDFKARYLAGIRHAFDDLLGQPAVAKPLNVEVSGTLVSNNTAGRDQNIEAVFNIDTESQQVSEQHEWVSTLCSALKDHLKSRRIMIVLMSGSTEDQSKFWTSLWSRASQLIEDGLLLVRLIDEAAPASGNTGMPLTSHCEITLPTELSESAVRHATEDIARILREHFPSKDESSRLNFAQAYVALRKRNITELHDGVVRFATDLGEIL